jgi:hypothetical protein
VKLVVTVSVPPVVVGVGEGVSVDPVDEWGPLVVDDVVPPVPPMP